MKKTTIIGILLLAVCCALYYFATQKKVEIANTKMTIVNATTYSVTAFLTLSGYPDSIAPQYVQSVDSVFGIVGSGLVGVFGYGCTDCIDTAGRQACQTPTDIPNTTRICNPTRPLYGRGGNVRLSFLGYTNTQICK